MCFGIERTYIGCVRYVIKFWYLIIALKTIENNISSNTPGQEHSSAFFIPVGDYVRIELHVITYKVQAFFVNQ